jgi:hypothetical protein
VAHRPADGNSAADALPERNTLMNHNSKIVLGAIAALFAVSFLVRFVMLSQAGVSGMWIFYLVLPSGRVVTVLLLMLRLGLLNFGERPTATVEHWQHNAAVPAARPWAAPTSQRLQELEDLRTSGAISDTGYAAKRARIISGI